MNPLLQNSPLPYNAPDFAQIKEPHFLPAFEEGCLQQNEALRTIAQTEQEPSFENTIVALELSGTLLNKVSSIFFALTYANNTPKLQEIEADIAPRLAMQRDALFLNDKIFERVKYLYDQKDSLVLDQESAKLLDFYYEKFLMSGALLDNERKEQLKAINAKEASLSSEFNAKLIAAANNAYLEIVDAGNLEGLSTGEITLAAQSAKDKNVPGKWIITITNTSQQPILAHIANKNVRRQLLDKSLFRTEQDDQNDTRSTILELARLRAEKAKILGFDNYAAWVLQDQMAKNVSTVNDFLQKLIPPAIKKAKEELQTLQAQSADPIQDADWVYYAEKVRKEKYAVDDDALRPYFELNNVLIKGVFFAATELYGIQFAERHDLPVYHSDVRVFELFEEDKTPLGLFYFDPFKRDNKSGGAWMENIVVQSHLLGTKPVIYNVCNYIKSAEGHPQLISFDDVTTLFHEFGHALHGFFANQKYPSLSGTAVARDFVELPSQFFEHWVLDKKVLNRYALHYATGEPISEELVKKIKKAQTFNQGYALMELLASSTLDIQWHSVTNGDLPESVSSFEEKTLQQFQLNFSQIPPRYKSSYFQHIWGNGYPAGYYAYQWTEMLENDVCDWFDRNGGLTRANGQRFRDIILSKGNTEDYYKLFTDFVGHELRIEPMLRRRGLL